MDIISIDGTTGSNLNWSQARKIAQGTKSPILWNIDFGLFDRLPLSLRDESQCKTLGLALEHFCNTLWEEFFEQTVGICIYQGPLDYSLNFRWDEEQNIGFSDWMRPLFEAHKNVPCLSEYKEHLIKLYCRDVCTDYFDVLSSFAPANLQSYVILDGKNVLSPLLCAQLLSEDRYGDLHCIVKHQTYKTAREAKVGICLPEACCCLPFHFDKLEQVFAFLEKDRIPFRVISEARLTFDWDGIDDLFIAPSGLSSQGRRKLQGFSAAGGRVINTGGFPVGIDQEITLQQWLDGGMMRENTEVFS